MAIDTMGRLLLRATMHSGDQLHKLALSAWLCLRFTLGSHFPKTFPSNVGTTGQPLLLTYTYDSAERLLTASSNWASSGDTKHPGTLFQASTNASLPAYGPMDFKAPILASIPQQALRPPICSAPTITAAGSSRNLYRRRQPCDRLCEHRDNHTRRDRRTSYEN